MRLVLLIGVCFMGCVGPQLSTRSDAAKIYYRNALKSERSSAWDDAIDGFRRAIKEDNRFIEAYVALGKLYDRLGNYTKASQFYESALGIDESYDDILFLHAKALFNCDQFHESYLSLLKYHNIHPENAEATSWLAECARALNDPNAGAFFTEAAKKDTGNVELWISLARYYFGEKEYSKALPIYEKIVGHLPQRDPEIAYEFGVCLALQARWNDAAKVLENARSVDRSSSDVSDWLILIRSANQGTFDGDALRSYFEAVFFTGRETPDESARRDFYQTAIAKLELAMEREKGFKLALRERARIFFILGHDDSAIEDYESLIAHNSARASDYANAAYLFFRRGNYGKAKNYYSQSLRMDSSQAQVRDYLATVQNLLSGLIDPAAYQLYEKGLMASEVDSAVFYLRRAIDRDSTYYEAYLQLGITYLKMNRQKDAEQQFIRGLYFVDDREVQRVLHYNLALTYLDLNLHDRAVQQFLSALEIDSLDGDARYYLAKTYEEKSELDKAVAAYDRLLALHPDYFSPSTEDFQRVGLPVSSSALSGKSLMFKDSLLIGQTNTYLLKIESKNGALIGADANGDLKREIQIRFRTQVLDLTLYGEAEFAVDILSVDGYALTPKEKAAAGQRIYLRVSDVFGLTNVYGLLEGDPYSLQQFIIQTLEDLHGSFLRKPVTQGEFWRSQQHVFQLGSIGAVAELDYVSDGRAFVKKHYGVQGSYNAARYGEEGMVSVWNRGNVEFEFDVFGRRILSFANRFTTREFREATASSTVQDAAYSIILEDTFVERIDPPKKIVLETVPYVRQHGPQCAAASLSMVMQFYGHSVDQDDIYAAIKSDFAGAQANDIVNYPRGHGKFKTFGYTGTLDDLKGRIDDGIPVLVFLTPFGYGHVVVVIGYDETKHQIIMHDPTVSSNHAVGYDEFLAEWRQSGNECAIVVPFDRTIPLDGGPIETRKAVELKWQGDKALGDRNYDQALKFYRSAMSVSKDYEGALEGVMLLHLQKDNFSEASAILDTLLQLNPTSIDLVLKRASLLLSQYDYDKVLQITRKAKQMDESNIINYIYTASALFAQKRFDEAIDEIKQAIRINPLQSTPRNLLAGYLAEVGEWDKSYEQAELAIRYEPENVGNYFTLSGIYQTEISNRFLTGQKKAANIKKAMEALDAVKAMAPEFPNLDQAYADIYTLADLHKTGDSLFSENIRKYPEENAAYNNYAWRLASDGVRLREAVSLSQKSIELSQRNPYYFDTMAWVHLKIAADFQNRSMNDSAEAYFNSAERLLKATIEYDRTSDFAYRHLGVVYAKWGKKAAAAEQFKIVVEMLPDRARACVDLGKDCEEAGIDDLAIEFYEKALAEKANMDFALYRFAYLAVKNARELGRAHSMINHALAQDSTNFLYRGVLGMVELTLGNASAAESHLSRAISEQASYPDREAAVNYYYWGLALEKLGRRAESAKAFAAYLKAEPNGTYAAESKRRMGLR